MLEQSLCSLRSRSAYEE